MTLISFSCEGYKPFIERARIDLAPLTLVFGHNNAGKSALVRLPLLLLRAVSLRHGSPQLPLEVDGLRFGQSFVDLVHAHSYIGEVTFSLSLRDGSDSLNIEATVQNLYTRRDATHRGVISRLRLTGAIDLEIEWQQSGEAVTPYLGHGPIAFRGLLPDGGFQGHDLTRWRRVADHIESRLEHLGPHRACAQRSYSRASAVPLGRDGSGSPYWLRENSRLLSNVADWLETNLVAGRLVVDQSGDAFTLNLRQKWSDNLADAGEGCQQALPVVVQQINNQLSETGLLLSIVEQPANHLHDAAQGALADLYVDTVSKGRGPVLVETHSEIFLLRIRRRIAEGRLRPADVAIYWVAQDASGCSRVRRVEVNSAGDVRNWPQGVYAETFNEVAALNRAQQAQR